FDKISEWGGNPIMWKAGHSLIKKKMKKEQALLGGEMSGHYFFADRYYGFDDAIYAACRLIETVKKEKGKGLDKFSSLWRDITFLFSTPELRVECPDDIKEEVVKIFGEKIKKIEFPGFSFIKMITIDGVRAVYDKGWALVRKSNTQPALVLRFEAKEEGSLRVLQERVTEEIEEIKRSLAKG
ncbi:MAG: phosphomannomutase, partial [Actinomycetia bacterium]|nr:phosphomannomutase [Actinomycetes bacterium]